MGSLSRGETRQEERKTWRGYWETGETQSLRGAPGMALIAALGSGTGDIHGTVSITMLLGALKQRIKMVPPLRPCGKLTAHK